MNSTLEPPDAVKAASTPRIYSLRKGAETPPADAVYVGRYNWRRPQYPANEWFNPYNIDDTDPESRDLSCTRFADYAQARLMANPHWLEPLRGKSLVCWCQSPGDNPKLRCHAEWLLKHANTQADTLAQEVAE